MKHQEKVDAMYRHMAELGVRGSTAAPPAWRLLWRIGLEVPPPLFLGFWQLAVASGASFVLLFVVGMFLASTVSPVSFSWLSSMCAGVVFGVVFAAFNRVKANQHKLPLWAEYKGQSGKA